jgi:hypothetical protein
LLTTLGKGSTSPRIVPGPVEEFGNWTQRELITSGAPRGSSPNRTTSRCSIRRGSSKRAEPMHANGGWKKTAAAGLKWSSSHRWTAGCTLTLCRNLLSRAAPSRPDAGPGPKTAPGLHHRRDACNTSQEPVPRIKEEVSPRMNRFSSIRGKSEIRGGISCSWPVSRCATQQKASPELRLNGVMRIS